MQWYSVVGEDYNIYTIPAYENKVVKFNTATQVMLEVGNRYNGDNKWN